MAEKQQAQQKTEMRGSDATPVDSQCLYFDNVSVPSGTKLATVDNFSLILYDSITGLSLCLVSKNFP